MWFFGSSSLPAERPGDPVLLHGSVALWTAALGGQTAGPALRQRLQNQARDAHPHPLLIHGVCMQEKV